MYNDFDQPACSLSEFPWFSGNSCSYTLTCPSSWLRLKLVQQDPNNPNYGFLEVYSSGLRCQSGDDPRGSSAAVRINVWGGAGTYNLGFPGGVSLGGGGSYMRLLSSYFLIPGRYQCNYSQAGESCSRDSGQGDTFPGSIGITVPYDNPSTTMQLISK